MSDDRGDVDSHAGNNGHTPDGKFAAGNGIGHRFARGNKHGRGNPIAIKMHEGRLQFLEAIDAGTLPALAKRLQVAALEGDLEATKLLLGYCLGRPQQAIELSGPDGGPLVDREKQHAMLRSERAFDLACELEAALIADEATPGRDGSHANPAG